MSADSSATPRVSIVVPSWTGDVTRLRRSIETQTFRDYEIVVVKGVSPASRARNQGVAQSRGELLVFVDDDAYRPGPPTPDEDPLHLLRADALPVAD